MTHARLSRVSKLVSSIALAFLLLAAPSTVLANEQNFSLGRAANAGLDTGYSENNSLTASDVHFGWQLGSFNVGGFTSVQRDGDSFTFIKTVGHTIRLSFKLDQDIDSLNGDSSLSISSDKDGYDQKLEVGKSEAGFGRGTLIIRKTDYQNVSEDPVIYNDYLPSITSGADTEVALLEEGDYEVVLDYEVKHDVRTTPSLGPIPSLSILPEYSNYTIRFKFSVRNGNTVVFLFDAQSGSELTNESTAPNGFKINMTSSHYLDINVKREVLSGESFDVRFNGPAEDGAEYTQEGVYTITATNQTTGQTTEKIIYVGDDPKLKAYATTGYTIAQIDDMVSQGATIDSGGTISWPETNTASASAETDENRAAETTGESSGMNLTAPILVATVVATGAAIAIARRRHGKAEAPSLPREGDTSFMSNADVEPDSIEDGDPE
ncbi:hypothetical protein [Paratractidigestivibacter sp.]|uniref:hypothetical protein n=1 Tax=Paratractidigestivibacter sp. TaxID=2847316 RepID=UPI002ACB1863|nr:hypothetical protein [Paratractidigestivibacter sp.]